MQCTLEDEPICERLRRNETLDAAVSSDEREPAFFVEHRERAFRRSIDVDHGHAGAHRVARRRVGAELGDRGLEPPTGQNAHDPARLDDGEVVLETVRELRRDLAQRRVCTDDVEAGDLQIGDRHARERRARLLMRPLGGGSGPDEERDEEQHRLKNSPAIAKSTAIDCPRRAAISVARTRGSRIAKSARATRPPSMGNAGSTLNAAREAFIQKSWTANARTVASSNARATAHAATASTTLTAGPAIATSSSCFGWSGMRSILATPPMGSSVMSRVRIP